MESFALFHNAKVLGKKAACIVTITDSLISHEATTHEERQKCLIQMTKRRFHQLQKSVPAYCFWELHILSYSLRWAVLAAA